MSSNPSVALSTSQLIVQPFFRFSYVTGSSRMSPGELPMLKTELQPWFLCLQRKICPWAEHSDVVDDDDDDDDDDDETLIDKV